MIENFKIVFITTGDILSIATMKRALGLANPMQTLGWQISIIAEDTLENRKRIALECSGSIEIYFYSAGNVLSEIKAKTRLVNQIKPQIIYFCSFGPRNFLYKSKAVRKARLLIEHSELPSGIIENSGLKRIKALIFEYYSMFYADNLINASKYLMTVYKRRFNKLLIRSKSMLYSPFAYNSEIISQPAIIYKQLKEKYHNKTVFLYMGTMTRNYGLFTMIEAMQKLNGLEFKAVLLLMGRGRHLKAAEQYVVEKNIGSFIEFLGYVPETELSSYFELANAFLSPLHDTVQDWARCPSKIYMYLPYAKPILTSKIGEPYEIFGEKGNYFNADKPEELTALFSKVVNGNLDNYQIDFKKHSWEFRAIELDKWIKEL